MLKLQGLRRRSNKERGIMSTSGLTKSIHTRIQYFGEYLLLYCVNCCTCAGPSIDRRMRAKPLSSLLGHLGSFAVSTAMLSIVSSTHTVSLQLQECAHLWNPSGCCSLGFPLHDAHSQLHQPFFKDIWPFPSPKLR